MIGLAILTSGVLGFQVPAASRPALEKKPPVQAPAQVADENDNGKAMAEYVALRDKTPATAAGQWKLGLWCEKNGLKPEAYVHFSEAVRPRSQP